MTRVYLVSQILQRLGYSVEIVGCQFGQSIYPPPPENLPVIPVPGKPLPGFMSSATQLLSQIRGDIIYAIKPRPTSLGIALLKKFYTRRPVFLDIDDWELSWFGGDGYDYRPSPKDFVRDFLKPDGDLRDMGHHYYVSLGERWVNHADVVTVNNQFLQQKFGGHYLPNSKDTHMFDPARFDPAASRQKYGLSDYRVLMFPGTARPHKGLEDVLMALDQLNQPDLRLVIVGGRKPDGYEDDLMARWPQWLIKLPRFPMEQMAEVVAAAHVVVVPQRDTPTAKAQFPIKLTDGMSMAKPILSTHVGDIPKILGDTGYLVAPHAPEELAKMLQIILDNPDQAAAQGSLGRERCIQHYSVDAMAERLGPLLERYVRRSSPHASPSAHCSSS
ncbi:glycosyltransferase family 4 protein [Leptothoe kymatousa]|uniref:Glycosyltransferase family 4 protein n=1 Tax=Leptothoe kymatousa TAU-MAC 1615 TaxID=2364775 RepID=A0ABS5Y0W0_9CYAN|nr:glycosyltransferase family 4 protein [Leptothoe kymatousa TAU-MAC 1615]